MIRLHKVIAAACFAAASFSSLHSHGASTCGEEALDALIAKNDAREIRHLYSFRTVQPGACNVALQKKILEAFEREEIAAALLPSLATLDDPKLQALVMADVKKLAERRADRRKRCRAKIASYSGTNQVNRPGLQAQSLGGGSVMITRRKDDPVRQDFVDRGVGYWNHECTPPELDQNLDNRDALPNPPQGMRRDYASVEAISRATGPGVDGTLSALLTDLSLYPAADWSAAVGGRPPGVVFNTLVVPWKIVNRLVENKASAAPPGLLAVLKEFEDHNLNRGGGDETARRIPSLLQLQLRAGTRESTVVLTEWIVRFSTISDPRERADVIYGSISLLGTIRPDAQVDLGPTKRRVFENVPYKEIAHITQLFANAEASSARLGTQSAR